MSVSGQQTLLCGNALRCGVRNYWDGVTSIGERVTSIKYEKNKKNDERPTTDLQREPKTSSQQQGGEELAGRGDFSDRSLISRPTDGRNPTSRLGGEFTQRNQAARPPRSLAAT